MRQSIDTSALQWPIKVKDKDSLLPCFFLGKISPSLLFTCVAVLVLASSLSINCGTPQVSTHFSLVVSVNPQTNDNCFFAKSHCSAPRGINQCQMVQNGYWHPLATPQKMFSPISLNFFVVFWYILLFVFLEFLLNSRYVYIFLN